MQSNGVTLVANVTSSGAARRCGLTAGDQVVALDGIAAEELNEGNSSS